MVLFGVFPVTPGHTRNPEGNPHDRADRATVPAACPLSFGITNELRTALEALADKADTCVAEVARDCIEAGIGAVRARLRPSRRRNGQKGGAPDLGNSRAWTRGVDWLASLHTTIRARACRPAILSGRLGRCAEVEMLT